MAKIHLAAYDHPATWTVCNSWSHILWKWKPGQLTDEHAKVTCTNCLRKMKNGTQGGAMCTVFSR